MTPSWFRPVTGRSGGGARRFGNVVCTGVLLAVAAGCGGPTPPAQPSPTASVPLSTTMPPSPAPSSATRGSSTSSPGPAPAQQPPFVATASWVRGSGGRSLHIVPTPAGRAAQGAGDADEAWSEVMRLRPDADQPGMRAQFDCHWTYARLVQPDKPSWDIEPWRPVVSDAQLVEARCNPGGAESADG